MSLRKVKVNRRGFQIGMPEQCLYGRQVRSLFYKVCGETVSNQIARRLVIPARCAASRQACQMIFGVMGLSARQPFRVPGNR